MHQLLCYLLPHHRPTLFSTGSDFQIHRIETAVLLLHLLVSSSCFSWCDERRRTGINIARLRYLFIEDINKICLLNILWQNNIFSWLSFWTAVFEERLQHFFVYIYISLLQTRLFTFHDYMVFTLVALMRATTWKWLHNTTYYLLFHSYYETSLLR